MEEMILKYAEFGVLGVITLLLLTKGLSTLNTLTQTMATFSDSQKALADSIAKLADKISEMSVQLGTLSFQITNLEKRIDKLEENSVKNFMELKNCLSTRKKRNNEDK